MKTTSAMVGAVVAMSLVTNAVLAQQAEAGKPWQEFKGPVKVFILAGQAKIATCPESKGTLGYVRTAPFWYPELDELPQKMEAAENRVRTAVAVKLKEQLKDQPESADPKKLEQLIKEAGDTALEQDSAYQKAKEESDRHVCNWYCHYQGSARVYCMVGYSLAEAMKPVLKTKP